MISNRHRLPVVLAIGGHDPGGGAGIQADIEAIAANGCHATSVITCLTVQDSCNLESLTPMSPVQMLAQAETVLADQPVAAIKIGLIGDLAMAETLVYLLQEEPNIPVVLDPVLATGGGADLATDELLTYIREQLLPLCSLITPNSLEARRLSERQGSPDSCARDLLEMGAKAVLITGTHEEEYEVTNRLYDFSGLLDTSSWERLPGEYHGSGCTLASAIAAELAQQHPLLQAVKQAQEYTWLALSNAFRSGNCQSLPDRLFALQRSNKV